MLETYGSALETEIAYRRERLQAAAGTGAWTRSGGRWGRRYRRRSVAPRSDSGRN